jgi:hypothetical protein
MIKILFALAASTSLLGASANAAELLIDPDEFFHQHMLFRTNQSPTLVVGDNVNVRTLPGFSGNANTIFARLTAFIALFAFR